MLALRTWTDLERVIEAEIPEGPSVDYKREISLAKKSDRIEVLKDLTGMANGGGGTIVFGVEEDTERDGIPATPYPLADESLSGVLEDVVRSGVRPPLLARYTHLRDPSGSLVLVVDVQPSRLGPFMVEAYDQRRYFTRVGRSTEPMSEQQVRDAYTLAARSQEERFDAWARHALPFDSASSYPWLTVSGLPLGALQEVFDPRRLVLHQMTAEEIHGRMRTHADFAGLMRCTNRLVYWSDGIFGSDDAGEGKGASHVFRLHRDGAAAIGMQEGLQVDRYSFARALNGQLAYLGWVWEKIELRMPVEIDIRMSNLDAATIIVADSIGFEKERSRNVPEGAPFPRAVLRREVVIDDLNRAPVRHGLVKEFSDRFHQAFGIVEQPNMFSQGWLYRQDVGFLRISVAGRGVFDEVGSEITFIDKRGAIQSKTGDIVAWLVDGVVLDNEGRALAACELAPGVGLPDDFAIAGNIAKARPTVAGANPGTPIDPTHDKQPPATRGEWSSESLQQLVTGH